MTIFLETPWPILLVGIAVEAVLAIILLRTGQGRALWAMLGVAAFVFVGLLVERLVVTDHEGVSDTIDACVAAVEANDLNRLLEHVVPIAAEARADAQWAFGRFEFRAAHMSDPEITINQLASPPMATAKFHLLVAGRDRQGEVPYESYAQRVTVSFRKENGRWFVTDYDRDGFQRPR